MDYQIWTKEYEAGPWSREDAGDIEAAKRIILAASKEGKESILTVEVPFSLELKVGEPGGEVKKARTPAKEKTKEKPGEESQDETNKDKPE